MAKKKLTNEEFRELPKKQQIVAVAKDVISLLKNKSIQPSSSFLDLDNDTVDTLKRNGNLQSYLPKIFAGNRSRLTGSTNKYRRFATCHCCAAGACFVAYVNRANGYMIDQDLRSVGSVNHKNMLFFMRKIFGEKLIQKIEIAYEAGWGYFGTPFGETKWDRKKTNQSTLPCTLSKEEFIAARRFNNNGIENETRIVAIMENIIKNNGDFVLSDPPIKADQK